MNRPGSPTDVQSSTGKSARPPLIRALVLVLTGAAAGILIASEFAPLFTVRAGGLNLRTLRAGDHHGYALALLAVVALALAWAGTRPALVGLFVVGLAALAVVLFVDWPDAVAGGFLAGVESARAHARVGLWLELGGALCLLAPSLSAAIPRGSRREVDGAPTLLSVTSVFAEEAVQVRRDAGNKWLGRRVNRDALRRLQPPV